MTTKQFESMNNTLNDIAIAYDIDISIDEVKEFYTIKFYATDATDALNALEMFINTSYTSYDVITINLDTFKLRGYTSITIAK